MKLRSILTGAIIVSVFSCVVSAHGELHDKKYFIRGFVGDFHVFLNSANELVLGQGNKDKTPVTFVSAGVDDYYLRLPNGKFLSVNNNNERFSLSDVAGVEQKFGVVQNNDGSVNISSPNGKYVRTNYNTYVIDQSPNLAAWEMLELIEADSLDGRSFFLQGHDGKFVSYESDTFSHNEFGLTVANPQAFKFSKIYNDSYIISLKHGNLSADINQNDFSSTPYHLWPEKFVVDSPDNILYNIRSLNNNTYLRANTDIGKLDQAKVAHAWEHFQLIPTDVAPSSYYNNWGVFEQVKMPFVFNQRNAHALKLTGKGVGVVFYDSWVNFANDPDLPKLENKQILKGGGYVIDDGIKTELVEAEEDIFGAPANWNGDHSHGTIIAKILMGRAWKGFRGVAPNIDIFPMTDQFGSSVYKSMAHINKDGPHKRKFRIASLSIQFNSFDEIANQTDVIDGDFMLVVIAGNNPDVTKQLRTPLAQNMLPKGNPIYDRLIITVALDPKNNKTPTSKECGADLADYCVGVPSNYWGVTSPTAPIVSGLLALLMEKFPDMPIKTYQEAILLTATPLGAPELTGRGLLNAEAAYKYLEARWVNH